MDQIYGGYKPISHQPIVVKAQESLSNQQDPPKTQSHSNVNASATSYLQYCIQNKLGLIKQLEARQETPIFGVVISWRPPKKTKGSDYSASYTLIDPGCPDLESGIVLNMFRSQLSEFPPVQQVGDVVFCDRAIVKMFGSKKQLISYKLQSTCIGIPIQPYLDAARQKGNLNHMALDIKENLPHPTALKYLILWSIGYIIRPFVSGNTHRPAPVVPLRKSQRPLLQIGQLSEPNSFCDMNCIVIGKQVEIEKTLLVVTDLTENTSMRLAHPFIPYRDGYGLRPNMAFFITVMESTNNQTMVEEGDYVFLRNVNLRMGGDGLQGYIFYDKARPDRKSVTQLYQDDPDCQVLINAESKWMKEHRPPTVTSNMTPHVPILDVLKETRVPLLFHCRGAVIDHRPANIVDFCSLICKQCQLAHSLSSAPTECLGCTSDLKDATIEFRFLLLIYDGTGYLPVNVDSKEATQFMNGIQPASLYSSSSHLDQVKQRLGRLFDISRSSTCPFENTPVLDFTVESFRTEKEGPIRYRMRDTKIQLDDE